MRRAAWCGSVGAVCFDGLKIALFSICVKRQIDYIAISCCCAIATRLATAFRDVLVLFQMRHIRDSKMPTFEVRNRRTKMVLGEVVVERPDEVIDALLDVTGTSVDELASSLGGTLEEATAALDIVEVPPPVPVVEKHQATRPLRKAVPAQRRPLYAEKGARP